MLFSFFLVLLAAADLSLARRGPRLRGRVPPVVKHGVFPASLTPHSSEHARRAPINRRQASNSTGCSTGSQITIKAPKTNIFAGLTDDEAAAVTLFLHGQKSLNLTAAADATRY